MLRIVSWRPVKPSAPTLSTQRDPNLGGFLSAVVRATDLQPGRPRHAHPVLRNSHGSVMGESPDSHGSFTGDNFEAPGGPPDLVI